MSMIGQEVMAECEPSRMQSTTERLHYERERLQARLKEVDSAIEAIEANPEIQKAIDAISKLGHF